MKYRFSNYEENTIAKDGQPRDTRAECDICGVMHRGDHGYELEYGMLHLYGRYRVKMCEECASEYIPKIVQVMRGINEHRKFKTQDDKLGALIGDTVGI